MASIRAPHIIRSHTRHNPNAPCSRTHIGVYTVRLALPELRRGRATTLIDT
jgi:hypothetical protein